MVSPREDLLRGLLRQGFDKVHVDYALCPSQIENFRNRFGNSDYESYFGLSHRKTEIPVNSNFADGRKLYRRETLPESTVFDEYGIGQSKGSEMVFHMKRIHHPLNRADAEEIYCP